MSFVEETKWWTCRVCGTRWEGDSRFSDCPKCAPSQRKSIDWFTLVVTFAWLILLVIGCIAGIAWSYRLFRFFITWP